MRGKGKGRRKWDGAVNLLAETPGGPQAACEKCSSNVGALLAAPCLTSIEKGTPQAAPLQRNPYLARRLVTVVTARPTFSR